ncbi:MAG: dTDP-4-dehydrorhamnose 3,5-epimerase [Bdellovibrionales bacterium]
MRVIESALDGLVVFENKRFADERGFFEEFFNQTQFGSAVAARGFVQVNHSHSLPGVIRGLHFQLTPPQGKLVGVIAGRIWDVAVDIRTGSPTLGRHFAAELSAENGRMLWIPAGFAHGFCVMGDSPADVLYLVDEIYNPRGESGILWNDSDLNVPWPLGGEPIVSARDRRQPSWSEFVNKSAQA